MPARSAVAIDDHGLRTAPLPASALDDRIAIVGTAGSGKTYAAKGFVERLLDSGARVAIVDPLGVWWGFRASADGGAPGYPVVVFGGKHADVPINSEMGAALGRLIANDALACVIDLSDLGSNAARRRFMAAFCEALYEANEEPLHLVLDEADLWAPQRPIKGWEASHHRAGWSKDVITHRFEEPSGFITGNSLTSKNPVNPSDGSLLYRLAAIRRLDTTS